VLEEVITPKVEQAASELTVSGAQSGPTLAVILGPEQSSAIVNRLAALPSLAYLRGVLIVGEAAEDPVVATDDVLDLRGQKDPVDMFWTLLARATSLGMIAGRGIPARYLPRVLEAA